MKKAFVIALIAAVSIGAASGAAQADKDTAGIQRARHLLQEIATVINKSQVKIAVDFMARGCKSADYNSRSSCKKVILAPGQSFTYTWPADPIYHYLKVVGRVVIKPLTGKTEKNFIYDQPFKPIGFTGSIIPTPAQVPHTKNSQKKYRDKIIILKKRKPYV